MVTNDGKGFELSYYSLQERNGIAESIFRSVAEELLVKDINTDTKAIASKAVESANNIMCALYGEEWDKKFKDIENKNKNVLNITSAITIAEIDGTKGVCLTFDDINIFIEPEDLDCGKEFEWKEAKDRLKELGLDTFSKRQANILLAFKDRINEKMREIGGKELTEVYWCDTENSNSLAWYFDTNKGRVHTLSKWSTLRIRAIEKL